MDDNAYNDLDNLSDISLEQPLSPSQKYFVDEMNLHTDTTNNSLHTSSDPNNTLPSHRIAVMANYVNLQLTAHGYPVPLIFDSNDENDIIKVLDCFQTVLQDITNLQKEDKEKNGTIITLQQEQEQLQVTLDQQQREMDKYQQEIVQARNKERSAKEQSKKTSEDSRHVMDELSKCKNNMKHIKLQYAHETRRHELEHAKTRDRLNKILKEKLKTNVIAMHINQSSPITELDIEPGTTPLQDERDMNKDLLKKSTDREMEARKECEDLRTAMIKMYTSIRRLVESQIEEFESSVGIRKSGREMARNMEKYKLPMDFGGSQAMEQVNMMLDTLQEEWTRQITDRKVHTEEEMNEKDLALQQWQSQVTELEETIDRMQHEHDEKEKVRLRFANGGFFDELAPSSYTELSDSESSVQDDHLSMTAHYQQLQRKAKMEQRKITEAAIKLGNERSKLEAERWAFEKSKLHDQLPDLLESASLSSSQSKRQRTS
ncbi:unnamed protein product [Absidia cylindrospora]